MKSIGIVGVGYVGKAMLKFFEGHYHVLQCDKMSPVFAEQKANINSCDLGVICVPTPRGDDGSCDISAVEETIGWLNTPLILLKSTVEIGTTDILKARTKKRIVFSPEYCGESSYWSPYKFHTDIKETPFFIFGGAPKDTSAMVDFFMPVVGPTKTYRQTDAKTAEIVKYMENSFYAMKIAYCYELYEICKQAGIDYNEARELWLLDPRINPMHTSVFPENLWPFSGKCLPKDTSALVEFAKKIGYSPTLLAEVLSTNRRLFERRKARNGN